MSSGAELVLHLHRRRGRINEVVLQGRRPPWVGDLLRGSAASYVPGRMRLMFGVCGEAQATAARAALADAGVQPGGEGVYEHPGVLLEWIREHLWRLGLCLPRQLLKGTPSGLTRANRALQGVMGPVGDDLRRREAAVNRLESALFEIVGTSVLADSADVDSWLDGCDSEVAAALRWVRDEVPQGFGVASLPSLEPAGLRAVGDCLQGSRDLAVWPRDPRDEAGESGTAQAGLRETGPFARQRANPALQGVLARHGPGILPRLLAAVLELLVLPGRLRNALRAIGVEPVSEEVGQVTGTGCGIVDTARGLLLHWVRLHRGQVADYAVVAPTEWNFHPRGVLVSGLRERPGGGPAEGVRRLAELAVLALNPCVGSRVEVH
ncbi:nickel-dependent hydrogenase large subunit [Alkalilimnicola ehrlichii]|uniref:nickel-dependent hydrogenase large subunit n=1 Tax=Alkalilimnicola ehrlichii TaxID=351052 RepID=UPI003B9F2106